MAHCLPSNLGLSCRFAAQSQLSGISNPDFGGFGAVMFLPAGVAANVQASYILAQPLRHSGVRMKWLKRILIVLVLLLVAALALPLFVTLDSYRPQIEQAASDRLGEPVKVAAIGLALLPLPHVTVEGIAVGKDARLDKVTVTPELASLWQPIKVISSIELDGLVLTQQALGKLPRWAKPKSDEPSLVQVRIGIIRITGARLELGKNTLGPLDGTLQLDNSGAPTDARLATQDGKLAAEVRFEGKNYPLEINAKAWTLPVGPALLFDELRIKGVATADDLVLDQLDARLYGGTVAGKSALNWQKGLRLKGELDIRQLELKQLVALFSSATRVSGRLDAQPVFSASAASADKLMDAFRLETPFNVTNGVLQGVDIEQAATSMSKQGASGGETRFDTLSGHLLLAQRSYHFTELKIASGALAVDGALDISPKQELSGRIRAKVGILGADASVPLNVSGTTDAPMLFPTGAAMTGAAVGTAVLGPGMGTAVGVKVGDWVEGLFGSKKDPKTGKK